MRTAAVLLLCLLGCGCDLPRDAGNTLSRVRGGEPVPALFTAAGTGSAARPGTASGVAQHRPARVLRAGPRPRGRTLAVDEDRMDQRPAVDRAADRVSRRAALRAADTERTI